MNNVILLGDPASHVRSKVKNIESLQKTYNIIDWVDDTKSNQLDQLDRIRSISSSLLDIMAEKNVQLSNINDKAMNMYVRINEEHIIYHNRSGYVRMKINGIVDEINEYIEQLLKDFETDEPINDVRRDQRAIDNLRNNLVRLIQNNSTYINNHNMSSSYLINQLNNMSYNDIDQASNIDRIDDNSEHNHIDNDDHIIDDIIFSDVYSIDDDNEVGMYIDSKHRMITNFMPITNKVIQSFNEYNIAPYDAIAIGVYKKDENGNPTGIFPNRYINIQKYIKKFGKRIYRVGLCSDIHYNDEAKGDNNPDTRNQDDGSEYHEDTINFLDLYQNKQEVEFICAAGDVGTNSINHDRNFKLMLNKYSATTPFFSCYGNHDYYAANKNQNSVADEGFGFENEAKSRTYLWNKVIIGNDSEYDTHHYTDTIDIEDPMSNNLYANYWFERKIPGTKKSDIYFFLSVDYRSNDTRSRTKVNYEDENVKALFDYVGSSINTRSTTEKKYDFNLYDSGVLIWFKNLLETKFKNKRVFVFTHLFFPHKSGTYNGSVSGLYSYGLDSQRISENYSAYILCGIQFDFLNKLNNEYPNTIWFTGHSHYTWEWQTCDKYINISNVEYEYVHPRDNDFNANKRYRYSPKFREATIPTPFKEMYYYNSKDNVEKKVIYGKTNISQENFNHNITIKGICSSSYTKTNVNAYGGSSTQPNSSCYLYIDSVNDNEVVRLTKEYFRVDEKSSYTSLNDMYEFEINVNISSPKTLEIGIYKELDGTNWHTLNIISIHDNDLNSDIYSENIGEVIFGTETSNTIGTPSSTVVPRTYRIMPEIIRRNTGYNVHLPSTCRPIPLGRTSYGIQGNNSEGAIMDVYEDYVDIRGIFFRHPQDDQEADNVVNNKEYINKYYALAQYRIPIKSS